MNAFHMVCLEVLQNLHEDRHNDLSSSCSTSFSNVNVFPLQLSIQLLSQVSRYAQQFSDDQFRVGDKVVVQIRAFVDEKRWLRGKIRGKL